MRAINILILSLIFSNVFSQDIIEQEIKSKVNEATVFLDGAQVLRTKKIQLTSGKQILKFVGLSPFIDAKSIQVKAKGAITVLSVNHQKNYLKEEKKSKEVQLLDKQIESLDGRIEIENTHLSIINDELEFLKLNRNIRGQDQSLDFSNLKSISEYYGTTLKTLTFKRIEHTSAIKVLHKEKAKLLNHRNTLWGTSEPPSGEILVKVDAKLTTTYSIGLSYMVSNVSWFPSYDIRAKNINEPVELIYKANVQQDTKVDWTGVKLKFSSSDPNISGVAPKLRTYFLNYNTAAPFYNLSNSSVRGRVTDQNGEALPGVSVIVKGTTIGAITNHDGEYNITVPERASELVYSFIGFKSRTMGVSGERMDIHMEESHAMLDDVVVVGYGTVKKEYSKALQGYMPGVRVTKDKRRIKSTNSLAVPFEQEKRLTSVDFEIKTPYSIKSDNKSYSVKMVTYELPASYQYYCIPKIKKDAFLMANISDWEKYNLLEGEANVFFEGTYIGKTLLDLKYAKDTLGISLGVDKMVSVRREKVTNFTTKQFMGNKKVETRYWKTTVKNNKGQDINMIVLDQVPISTLEEIQIEILKTAGAQADEKSGEMKWEFKLPARDNKVFELEYSVKYPKSRTLVIE